MSLLENLKAETAALQQALQAAQSYNEESDNIKELILSMSI